MEYPKDIYYKTPKHVSLRCVFKDWAKGLLLDFLFSHWRLLQKPFRSLSVTKAVHNNNIITALTIIIHFDFNY